MAENLAFAVRIKHLPTNITKEKIQEFIEVAGAISKINIGHEEAIVIFFNEEAAENSLMLDKFTIGDKEINIEKATSFDLKIEDIPNKYVTRESEKIIIEDIPNKYLTRATDDDNSKSKGSFEIEEKKKIPKNPQIPSYQPQQKSKVEKILNVIENSNIPARYPLKEDDLFAKVLNRKYGITVMGMWALYLVLFTVFRS